MNETNLMAVKLLFLLGFLLHNIEEAIWLPKWSQTANKLHKPVGSNEFIFAAIMVTMLGILLSAIDIIFGFPGGFINYLYLGFIGIMGINALVPHFAATVILKKYAPGLLTGIFLNLPFSMAIIYWHLQNSTKLIYLGASIVIVGVLMLFWLKFLFRKERKISNYQELG